MLGTFKILSIALAGVIFSLVTSFAQFTGVGNDQRYQSTFKVTQLEIIPPTENDMPARCLMGYSLLDSLSKGSKCNYIKDYIKYSPLDTLRSYSSIFYAVMDYSPALFSSYVLTADQKINQEKPYLTLPDCFYTSVQEVILQDRIEQFGKEYAFLFAAHYILKVHIDSVVVGYDTSSLIPLEWVNASCTILEEIKGIKLPSNCKKIGDMPFETPITNVVSDCMNFGYIKNTPTGTGFSSSTLPMGNIKTVRTGENYYLFLKLKRDTKNNDIVTPELRFEKTGGMFQVSNGIVFDPTNFWAMGNGIPEQLFLDNLNKKIDTIISWSNHKVYNGITETNTNSNSNFYITPNPITGTNINLNFSAVSSDNIYFKISDVHGKAILETENNYFLSGIHEFSLTLPIIPNGMYFISMVTSKSITTTKFFKI